LYGENGTLEVTADAAGSVARGVRAGEPGFQTLPIPDAVWGDVDRDANAWEQIMQAFTRLFIDSIIEDEPISPSFYDGIKAQAVIEAAFESDRSGYWTDVQ
jgi:predicted dehydrogenase